MKTNYGNYLLKVPFLLFCCVTVTVKAAPYVSASGAVYDEVDKKTTNGCKVRIQKSPNSTTKEEPQMEWSGGCKNGYLSGGGEFKFRKSNGERYRFKGTFADGRAHGPGVGELTLLDGKVIVIAGIKDRGFFQGNGTVNIKFPDGKLTTYKGAFLDDTPSGKGRIEYQDGSIYEGDVVKLSPNGYGKYLLPNGNAYEGEIKDKKPAGKGVLSFKNGSTIKGVFIDGKPPVFGRIDYPNGAYYEGELADLKPNGKGTSVSPDQTRFSGSFLNGDPDGEGFIAKADGRSVPVRIRNGNIQVLPTQDQLDQQAREERRAAIDQQAYENAVIACRSRAANTMAPTYGNFGEMLARAGQCNLDPEAFRTQTIVVQQQPSSVSCTRAGPFINCDFR